MPNDKNKVLKMLSLVIAFLAMIASAGGLFMKDLYRDNALVVAAWQGNDIVTLFVVVPIMLIAIYFLKGDPNKAQLFWLGSLWYMIYNYMFYLFGAAFNYFFLIYVAIFTLSIYIFVFALMKTDAEEISLHFSEKTPVKWISGFMIFFGALLGSLWIMLSLSFVFTGKVPQSIIQTDHPTGVVFASDLSLLIPALIFSAILLWKRHQWGYVLSSVVLIKATAYGLALIIMTLVSYLKEGIIDSFIILWFVLTLGCLLSLCFLLGNISKNGKTAV
jgi:hypothetical protein